MRDPHQIFILKQKYKNEQVLVVPTSLANNIPDSFSYKMSRSAERLFTNANTFVYRYDAEYNYSLTQLISYVVITDDEKQSLFVTERVGGEERLQHRYSLGAGGHVNPKDMSHNTMLTAAQRELSEELNIALADNTSLYCYGTVRDFDSPTREHLGLVYVVIAKSVEVKEKNTLRGQWMDVRTLVDNYNMFESWSRHIIDHMFVNNKKYGNLFLPFPATGAKRYDRKSKKTVRKNC